MSCNAKRKRSKSYYVKSAKRSKPTGDRKHVLVAGLKGFVLTCNNREKECVHESYNLLNQHADELYGPEIVSKEALDEEDDVEKALQQELEEMNTLSSTGRRFQLVRTGAKNCLFVKTNVESPSALVERIFSDIETKREQVTRFLLRMIPISVTCHAEASAIQKASKELLEERFKDAETLSVTYAVQFKARNNGSVSRQDVIPSCAAVFREVVAGATADLDKPDYVLNVEIIGSICCLGILPDYYKRKKYNLVEYAALVKKNLLSVDDAKKDDKTDSAENEGEMEEIEDKTDSAGNDEMKELNDDERQRSDAAEIVDEK